MIGQDWRGSGRSLLQNNYILTFVVETKGIASPGFETGVS
jgi:hypothetical protein